MEAKRTVFVVGAGASAEFGLPTGRRLLDDIHKKYKDIKRGRADLDLVGHLTQLLHRSGSATLDQTDEDLKLVRWIAQNAPLAPSIDNFLHSHYKNERIRKVVKLLITNCIVESERNSAIFTTKKNERIFDFLHRKIVHEGKEYSGGQSWLARIFWLLAEESDFQSFCRRLGLFTFISFNYDRCIEQFLLNAAISYFGHENVDLNTLEKSLSVLHPYGSVGKLRFNGVMMEGFGECRDFSAASDEIRTFTEGTKDANTRAGIRYSLANAQQIFFMGFGFLPINIDLLFMDLKFSVSPEMVGTGLNLSQDSRKLIEEKLSSYIVTGRADVSERYEGLDYAPTLLDLSCMDFLDHFHFRLRKL